MKTNAMMNAVTYYRVSTDRQGQSGLGLAAQQKSVHDFAGSRDLKLVREFTEVESGGKTARPVLQEALRACKKESAILLIAKLDRLGRNVAFISKLLESEVEFIAVDNPFANKLVVHIMAAFAEHERDQISSRTKDALQAAKERGVELGLHGKYVLSKQNREAANEFARKINPLIENLKRQGFKTIRQICDELNRLHVSPFRGTAHKWHPPTVYNLLTRSKGLPDKE